MAGSKRRNGQSPVKLKRPATTDRLQSKKAFRIFHDVVLDNEVVVALDAAQKSYDAAKTEYEKARARHLNYPANADAKAEHDDALAALHEAIEAHEEARQEAEEATFTFVLKTPPLHEVEDLRRLHPLTDKEREDYAKVDGFTEDKWPTFSQETIGPGMIALCLLEPAMTEDEVREHIWDNPEWNEVEKSSLLAAAYATFNRATVSLGKVHGPIRSNGSNSATSTPTPSLEASS